MAVPDKMDSQTLLSTLTEGCSEDFDIYCDQCDIDDIRLSAFGYCVDCEEYLCQTCFNNHRRPKSLRHHQLQDKDHMPQKQNLKKSPVSVSCEQTDKFTSSCPKHSKEEIKFYCHDHTALLCSVCVADEHTSASCHVECISETLGQIVDSTEYIETLQDLENLKNKCCQITKDLKQRVSDTTASLKSIVAKIENFRKEINERLDDLEQEAKDTATEIQNDNKQKLETTEAACNDINKLIQVSSKILKHFNTNKKADQLFTELKIAQQQIKNNEKRLSQLTSARNIDEITFKPNEAIKTLLQNEKSVGSLNINKVKQLIEPINPAVLEPLNMSAPSYINVKSSYEARNCLTTGIAAFAENQIFVADYSNYSVKKINIKSGAISLLHLELPPRDVSIVSKDTIAVTVPKSKTIQFISFTSNALKLKNQLQVNGRCLGISHHQGKLAVTFTKPAQLQIMNLKGIVKIKVVNKRKDNYIFGFPGYVTCNSHSIYVSDRCNCAVIRFNWQGEVIGRYVQEIRNTNSCISGITLFDDGSFLVCGNYSDRFTRVSSDCEGSATVLETKFRPTGIFWRNTEVSPNIIYWWDTDVSPKAICWCAKTKLLYVSSNTTAEGNYIQSYKIM